MRRTLIGLSTVAALTLVAFFAMGRQLTSPSHTVVGNAPAGLAAQTVHIPVGRSYVAGWFVRGQPAAGAVLLLHGVRADRRQMQGRVQFLAEAGDTVLLIDLPAHGESPGERISFGFHEADSIKAALAFLHQALPQDKIGVIGVSLGAASLVLANPYPAPSAVILESMYPTISEAVADRLAMRLGEVGRISAPLLLWQLPWQLGISQQQLRPIDHIAALGAPLLLASGTLDQHTTIAEARRLFDAAGAPKEFWAVESAAHVDLYLFTPRTYEARILAFLHRYLHNDRAASAQSK